MSRNHTYDQHFLRSPRLVAELVGHSNIRKNDLVYDFGAGSGVITSVLARRVRQVVAIEKEPLALAKLRNNLSGIDNVTIIDSDMMSVNLPTQPWKVFANPPFSLISQLVLLLVASQNPPKSIYLITQKQFARKVAWSDQHFTSALGIYIAPYYTARIRRPLKRSDFTPPPAVDTVLLELKLQEKPLLAAKDMEAYRKFVFRHFAVPADFIRLPLSKYGISSERKPSELRPEQWLQLFESRRR